MKFGYIKESDVEHNQANQESFQGFSNFDQNCLLNDLNILQTQLEDLRSSVNNGTTSSEDFSEQQKMGEKWLGYDTNTDDAKCSNTCQVKLRMIDFLEKRDMLEYLNQKQYWTYKTKLLDYIDKSDDSKLKKFNNLLSEQCQTELFSNKKTLEPNFDNKYSAKFESKTKTERITELDGLKIDVPLNVLLKENLDDINQENQWIDKKEFSQNSDKNLVNKTDTEKRERLKKIEVDLLMNDDTDLRKTDTLMPMVSSDFNNNSTHDNAFLLEDRNCFGEIISHDEDIFAGRLDSFEYNEDLQLEGYDLDAGVGSDLDVGFDLDSQEEEQLEQADSDYSEDGELDSEISEIEDFEIHEI